MTATEIKQYIIALSGSMLAFSRDYGLSYRTVQHWCYHKPNKAAVALVRQLLKDKARG